MPSFRKFIVFLVFTDKRCGQSGTANLRLGSNITSHIVRFVSFATKLLFIGVLSSYYCCWSSLKLVLGVRCYLNEENCSQAGGKS